MAKLKLTTLFDRRTRSDLIHYYKFHHEIDQINWYNQPKPVASLKLDGPAASVRGHKYRLNHPNINNCQARDNFFSNKVVQPWNNLKASTIEAATINEFKCKLDKIK